jgi:hypothetical protein
MSEKKVLGMSLLGIVKSGDPWKRAHEIGMKELAERANMPELLDKVNDENYFNFVKEALDKIDEYKDLPEDERISKRREQYFARVLGLIRDEDFIDERFVSFLRELKKSYRLVLITTNIGSFVDEVLKLADAESVFDNVICSNSEEEDSKKIVFDRAVDKVGKIDVFVGSEKSGRFCEDLGIEFIKYENIDRLKEELN